MVTLDVVEAWRQQAIEEGKQRGLEEGKQRGIERERALVLRLLRRRFGAHMTAEIERQMSAASLDQLEAWAERAVSGASLAELLADASAAAGWLARAGLGL